MLRVPHRGECITIECKGKNPGGSVSVAEIEKWLIRLPVFRAHLKKEQRFREAIIKHEIWTSGTFQPDALALLELEKKRRKANPIDWKNGLEVFSISNTAKEKTINNALKEHFLLHPLAD